MVFIFVVKWSNAVSLSVYASVFGTLAAILEAFRRDAWEFVEALKKCFLVKEIRKS